MRKIYAPTRSEDGYWRIKTYQDIKAQSFSYRPPFCCGELIFSLKEKL
jgi:hypothetical protein